jgi:hypothetical protein
MAQTITSFNINLVNNDSDTIIVNVPAEFTVTAIDQYNNVFTGYVGLMDFAIFSDATVNIYNPSIDPNLTTPISSYQFLSGDQGVHTFVVVSNTIGDENLEIDVWDDATQNDDYDYSYIVLTVIYSEFNHFTADFHCDQINVGYGCWVTITVYSSSDNSVINCNYNGKIEFPTGEGSSYTVYDPRTLPYNAIISYIFTGSGIRNDNGKHKFLVIFNQPGPVQFIVEDGNSGFYDIFNVTVGTGVPNVSYRRRR